MAPLGDAREQAMRLPPVMGLVIEDMQERELQLLIDVVRIADGVVADCSVEVGQCKRTDIGAMRASSCSRAARKPAKSSYRISSSRAGDGPSPVKRCIHTRSPTSRWLSVPCTEPKKAP